jgi:DNA-binding transcriptional ArsR family regulator
VSPLGGLTSSRGSPVPSITPATDHWVSAAAVRQAIGAWAYTLGAGEPHPTDEAVRAAVGVACAVRELATDATHVAWQSEWQAGITPAPTRSVPADLAPIGEAAGLAPHEVAAALTLLASAHAITLQQGASGAKVSLSDAVLAPCPMMARVAWRAARARLVQVGASVAPALAVLRELAVLLAPFDDGDAAAATLVRASVRDLEDATGFSRSTVSEAIAALARARLLDVETRAGRTARFTVRPAAFGQPDEEPRMPATSPLATGAAPAAAGPSPGVAGVGAPPRSAQARLLGGPSLDAGATGAPVLIGTFAGTPIYAPSGTPLVVECDTEGRWSCRVGPFLRLGPVEDRPS